MSIPPVWSQCLDFFGTPLVIEPSPGQRSGDAGLLPNRQFGARIGLTRGFAEALDDPRDPTLSEHTFLEMVRSRVYGILAGYEDQNDHDTLRFDPIFKLVAGRSPEDDDLASQPTLSRFENAVSIKSLKRLRHVFLDRFIASFDTPPRHLTFDLDAVDDPAHGNQQLTFWHGYYDQNQYLPLVITCADNDQFIILSLRPGNGPAALGADDLAYIVMRLLQVWPDVAIHFRGDCGFGVPGMYEVCEGLRVSYTFGLSTNAVLQRETEGLLAEAVLRAGAASGTAAGATAAGAVAVVHGLLVSSGDLAAAALGRGQGGGQRPGHQPPLRGDEPARGHVASGADL